MLSPICPAVEPTSLRPQPLRDAGVSGDVTLLSDFPSDALHNRRDIVVYLPPGYDPKDSSKSYPVLYAQDGQNLFDPETSAFGHEWHLDEWAEGLMRSGQMDKVIIVGIYNTPQRMSEYTPVPDPQEGGGDAAGYEDFLIHELKPFVDAHYHTRPDAAHTGIMGSSLGGLVSLDVGFKHPEVFGRVGALSPSLWWDDEELSKSLAAGSGCGPHKVFVSMGTREGDNPQANVDRLQRLHEILKLRGYQDGQSMVYRVFQNGRHDEDSWAQESGDALTSLFPPDPATR